MRIELTGDRYVGLSLVERIQRWSRWTLRDTGRTSLAIGVDPEAWDCIFAWAERRAGTTFAERAGRPVLRVVLAGSFLEIVADHNIEDFDTIEVPE